MSGYTTGQLAKLAAVNLETVRYYERRRLLPKPPRSSGGYRLYPESTVKQLRFIRRAQDLGFSLTEVKSLLAFKNDNDGTCDEVKDRVETKISDIDKKISTLKRMKKALTRLVTTCPGKRQSRECIFLASLDGEEQL